MKDVHGLVGGFSLTLSAEIRFLLNMPNHLHYLLKNGKRHKKHYAKGTEEEVMIFSHGQSMSLK